MEIQLIGKTYVTRTVDERVGEPGPYGSTHPWKMVDPENGMITLYSREHWEPKTRWAPASVGVSRPKREVVYVNGITFYLVDGLRATLSNACKGAILFERREPTGELSTQIRSKVDRMLIREILPEFTSSLGWKGKSPELGVTCFYDAAKWEPITIDRWVPAKVQTNRYNAVSGPTGKAGWEQACRIIIDRPALVIHLGTDLRATVVGDGIVAFEKKDN